MSTVGELYLSLPPGRCRIGACSLDPRSWPPCLALAAAAVPAQSPAPTVPQARPGRPLSPRTASYAITARLDPASRTIRGDEILTWRNPSSRPATTLQFHLYYNAWRNTRSTWMRERRLGRGDPALVNRPEADWGWIDVTSIRLVGGAAPGDITARMRFVAPDDGNADDRTVLEVPLDRAVAPGETLNVQIAWSARVPRTFARTGTIGNFYFVAQWFPKIGVLQDAGWNCHQFHSSTEFFSDFGTYDVRLTVPAGWLVGATGVERDTRDEGDGSTTHHYYQEDVHDFAWTTSPDYVERRARFEHPALPAVDMRLLLQPEHVAQADRHFEATRAALKYYGEWFGPYPYGHITIVDPAWQSQTGGMEYPTLFTAGHALDHANGRHRSRRRDRPRGGPPILVRHRGEQRVRARLDGRRLQHVLDGTRDRRSLQSELLLEAVLRRLHALGLSRRAAVARDRRRSPGRLPSRCDLRRTVNAHVAVLAGLGERDHLQQDRTVAPHARTDDRLGDHAAPHVHLLLAVHVQASAPGGLLRGGE